MNRGLLATLCSIRPQGAQVLQAGCGALLVQWVAGGPGRHPGRLPRADQPGTPRCEAHFRCPDCGERHAPRYTWHDRDLLACVCMLIGAEKAIHTGYEQHLAK